MRAIALLITTGLITTGPIACGGEGGAPARDASSSSTVPAFDPSAEGSDMPTPPPGQNRLAFETSPYLLQHASNPVDWYPWGEEAFRRAREEDKPLIISIGYSSCHWCHVMEHECFEVPEIAAVMNEHFICVKVDREERPDVDEIYMTAVRMMGLGGGWPLNVFVTPEGTPFFGGTYFPPKSYSNRLGWPDLLIRISQGWKEQRESILEQGTRLREALAASQGMAPADSLPGIDALERATAGLETNFDRRHGGFGGAPKFPPHLALPFLLGRHARTGDDSLLVIVERTLDAMDRGGIHDQLGGGFHRYSTDEEWLVPHFEKMLYDNAQLARAYTEAWQVTGNERWAATARSTLDYVLAEMTEPEGGFRSATDADSDGREGVYFVWKKPEVDELLGDGAALFSRVYGVSVHGDFVDVHHPTPPGEPGMNVLHLPVPLEEAAAREGLTVEELEARLAPLRERLLESRRTRTYPGLDDKILTAWNGLMIGAMAYAGRALDEPRYVAAAERAADFVLANMKDDRGRLLRTHRGGRSKIPAFLEDHVFLADALLDLYEATYDSRWLGEARAIAEDTNRHFGDDEEGGWFHTADDAEELITRTMSGTDGAEPGGNGVGARVMLRLASFTGEKAYEERADAAFRKFASLMTRAPAATLGLLRALDDRLHEDGESVIDGRPKAAGTRALLRAVNARFLPGTVLALLDPEDPTGGGSDAEPLLEGKTLVGGAEAVYICRNYSCRAPVTDREALAAALVTHRDEMSRAGSSGAGRVPEGNEP